MSNNPQHFVIHLASGARIEAADQLSHVVATLYAGDLTLRQVQADAGLRAAAHALLDDLIDHSMSATPAPGANYPLLSLEELRLLLRLPVTLLGSQVDLGRLRNAADAADALGGDLRRDGGGVDRRLPRPYRLRGPGRAATPACAAPRHRPSQSLQQPRRLAPREHHAHP